MSINDKKKLTGWLILLMVFLGISSFSGVGREITEVRQSYEPYFSQHSSLRAAVLIYQCILLVSACTALYTLWVLYQRIPGTLVIAKRAFVATIVLRISAGWIFDFVAGLPDDLRGPVQSQVIGSLVLACYGAIWYLYLTRSKRVRDIYAS